MTRLSGGGYRGFSLNQPPTLLWDIDLFQWVCLAHQSC
ncbi:hypothetical protein ykris0001_9640 [Yersinia kristensenii ATCC 33638]|nr:hypothetical protein ykris0001_9640 [Yersinia kristensenii ATCC 33638]